MIEAETIFMFKLAVCMYMIDVGVLLIFLWIYLSGFD